MSGFFDQLLHGKRIPRGHEPWLNVRSRRNRLGEFETILWEDGWFTIVEFFNSGAGQAWVEVHPLELAELKRWCTPLGAAKSGPAGSRRAMFDPRTGGAFRHRAGNIGMLNFNAGVGGWHCVAEFNDPAKCAFSSDSYVIIPDSVAIGIWEEANRGYP